MMRRIDYAIRGSVWPVAAVCLALSAWPLARPKRAAYEVRKLPIHNVAAATFGPSDSELTVVITDRRLKDWDPHATVPATIEVLNFRTGKLVLSRTIRTSDAPPSPIPYLLSYLAGGRELAYCDEFSIRLFQVPGYAEVARVSIGGPARVKKSNPPSAHMGGPAVTTGLGSTETVAQAVLSAHGGKLATFTRLVTPYPVRFVGTGARWDQQSFTIRLYDLHLRKAEGRWKFQEPGYVRGFAVSPSGARIAWSRYDPDHWAGRDMAVPRGVDNIKILDVATGKTIGIHTDDAVGRLAFASDQRLLSISWNAALRRNDRDGIRIWDAITGKLVGEVHSKPNGVHNALTISQDGRVVAGFVGEDKTNENFIDPKETRFRLWSPISWAILFTSPVVHPVFRDTFPPLFTLSPDGHSVLVWNAMSSLPLVVYRIPSWG